MCSGRGDRQLRLTGFPIRTPPDHSLVANSPGLIAGSNVLHRLLVPRHPPIALSSLSHNKNYKDARVHYTVLKIRAGLPDLIHHYPRAMTLRGKHTLQDTTTRSLVRAGPSHTPTPRSAR